VTFALRRLINTLTYLLITGHHGDKSLQAIDDTGTAHQISTK